MAYEDDSALNKAKKFVSLLNSNGFEVFEAYLFGSAAENRMSEDSDIDIAVVSDKFTGMLFYDALKISKFRRLVDLQIEVHPFALKEILSDPPLFYVDIKKKGIRIN